jgi:hypothetical protein
MAVPKRRNTTDNHRDFFEPLLLDQLDEFQLVPSADYRGPLASRPRHPLSQRAGSACDMATSCILL